jgi:hypothetical protein
MANRVNHQEVVKKLLDSKTVDFSAIGSAVAELGPSFSLADEPWDGFCGTMRTFVHLYVLPGTGLNSAINPAVENLGALRNAAKELQG